MNIKFSNDFKQNQEDIFILEVEEEVLDIILKEKTLTLKSLYNL